MIRMMTEIEKKERKKAFDKFFSRIIDAEEEIERAIDDMMDYIDCENLEGKELDNERELLKIQERLNDIIDDFIFERDYLMGKIEDLGVM